MTFVSGRVEKVVLNADWAIEGLMLDDGREVRFAANWEQLDKFVIRPGCLIGIEGSVHEEGGQNE